MTRKKEVVVICSGPGGYVAAIRASQLGKKVTIIEKSHIGGVCLNVGCIPSKALITASEKYHSVQEFETFGLEVENIKFDFEKVQDFKNKTVKRLTDGVQMLLKANKIELIMGEAKFINNNTLEIMGENDTEELEFEQAIIATGSRPKDIPAIAFSDRMLSSTDLLDMKKIPESLVVIGGGVIGIELANVFANFGTKVTILEGLENILPTINSKITNVVKKKMVENGIDIYTNARVTSTSIVDNNIQIEADIKGENHTFESEYALLSIGRTPNTDTLGLENTDVTVNDRGLIEVDAQLRTSQANIFAIGDIVQGAQLAHKASYEGKVAAEVIAGKKSINDYYVMPSVVFSHPEIAITGLNVKEAKDKGIQAKSYSFSYGGNGRAIALNETDGMVNLIVEEESSKVIGGEIVGHGASDMINEISLAIESGLTVEDLALTIHPHPTLGEIVMEAAELASGSPIHSVK